uniref:G-protein coupled receptors family 2 profile 1 domain-containing protein n=1 Tax=Hucho hucho TaxID=62062 RepID=A0A4W5LJP9_9TELE
MVETWDGWLCWEDTEAGFTTNQHCPDYFQDFDTAGLYFAPWLVSPTQRH